MLTIWCCCSFRFSRLLLALGLLALSPATFAEDGYELWQRYRALTTDATSSRPSFQQIIVKGDSPTLRAVAHELNTALAKLLPGGTTQGGASNSMLIAGTAQSDASIAAPPDAMPR